MLGKYLIYAKLLKQLWKNVTHLNFWLWKVLNLGKQPKLPLSDDMHNWKIFNLNKATKATVEKRGTFEILASESS